jgi:adenosylhomocysteinase
VDNHIADPSLADEGQLRVEWALGQMPVIAALKDRFAREKPFEGLRIGACLHVTTETANLVQALRAGGADVYLCASNPLSTQDDVAAYLAAQGVGVFSVRGEDHDTYYAHIREVLDREPHFTVDDGADLVSTIHRERPDQAERTVAGTEETTTGVIRLRQMAAEGALRYPIVAINDTPTKHLFDNRFGTGQSALDGVIRATNVLIAGKTVVVAGYGWCSKGIAMRANGLGANVIVTEIDPVKALEAAMDGFRVMPMSEAARIGDIFITATGDIHVLDGEDFAVMKDGAIVANSGHFNVEINVRALEQAAESKRRIRDFVDEYRLPDGRRIYLLGEGRLINLAAAEGHPAAVMDLSFANQALSVEYLRARAGELERKVYPVPEAIDREIARLKLLALGVTIDTLTEEQARYLASWELGT